VKAKRATYSAFIGAIDKGVSFLREHPAEALPLIGKYLGAGDDDVKGMLEGDKIYSLADNRTLFGTTGENAPAYATLRRVIDFTKGKGLIERDVNPAALIDASLVRASK